MPLPEDLKRYGEREPLLGEAEAGALFAAALIALMLLDQLGVLR